MSKQIVTVAAVVLAAGIGGYSVFLAAKPPEDTHRPVWTEGAWPFPVDQWGGGVGFSMQGGQLRD
jgi:hypothetical protein